MRRLLLPLLVLTSSSLAAAEPAPEVRKLAISPAAAPRPALRYELLPRLRDSNPGNRALEYGRSFELRPAPPKSDEERMKPITAWLDGPLDAPPPKEVKEYLSSYANALKIYDSAVRLDRYDGEWISRLRAEGVAMLLPGVQLHRDLARVLQVRHRVALFEGRYDDALRSLQALLRSGKDVGESPTLIQMLVGIALASLAEAEILKWIEKPGSPNLYWALTALPRPIIDPRPGLEGEAVFLDSILPNMKEFEKGPISADKANELVLSMFANLRQLEGGGEMEPPLARFATAAGFSVIVATQYEAAKKFLIEDGMKPDLVAKMSPGQVVALRSIRRVRALYDDEMKCFSLPIPQGRAEFARLGNHIKKARDENPADVLLTLASTVLPAMEKVHEAYARIERKFAALRVLEAIRFHAAANGGQLPRTLSDVTIVFVPDDPATGKPFDYEMKERSFTLFAPPPTGVAAAVRNSIRYEVTLR